MKTLLSKLYYDCSYIVYLGLKLALVQGKGHSSSYTGTLKFHLKLVPGPTILFIYTIRADLSFAVQKSQGACNLERKFGPLIIVVARVC